jgi:hypothetical protein
MTMDITTIDAVSFATRVGQAAASELYALLNEGQQEPVLNWFSPINRLPGMGDIGSLQAYEQLGTNIEALGSYVCLNQVDQGERLFRWGQMRAIVPAGDWATLDVAGKQAFEAFTLTTRHTYLGLAVAQAAIRDARKAAGVPATLKREDSIFEETESMATLRPEAIAASGLTARMQREGEAERQRQEDAAFVALWDEAEAELATREAFNGAPPTAFDHDGNGKPGGSRRRAKKPAPISAGETVPKAPVNRGGRGKTKAP